MSSIRALFQAFSLYRDITTCILYRSIGRFPYKILLSGLVQSNRKNNGNMEIENTVSQTIEIWLRIFGIWPNTTGILLRRLFWIVTLAIEQTFQYRYIIMHFHLMELFEMISLLSSAMSFTMFLIKLVIFWYQQR